MKSDHGKTYKQNPVQRFQELRTKNNSKMSVY